jgi:hypothetical protein
MRPAWGGAHVKEEEHAGEEPSVKQQTNGSRWAPSPEGKSLGYSVQSSCKDFERRVQWRWMMRGTKMRASVVKGRSTYAKY